MTFSKMIERMEDLVLSGMGVPFTPWTLINADKLVPLLDRIRENLPDEIRQAQQVLARREDMLAEAQRRAAHMIEDARRQADAILSDSELMRAIREEADRVRQQVVAELEAQRRKAFEEADVLRGKAQEEARLLKEGSERYADAVLSSLERQLSDYQGVVRNGQQHIRKSRAETAMALRHQEAAALSPDAVSPDVRRPVGGGIRPANIPSRPSRGRRADESAATSRRAPASREREREYLPLERPAASEIDALFPAAPSRRGF